MQMFIKTKDYELSNIVTKGSYVPMTTVDGKMVEKTEEQYIQEIWDKLVVTYEWTSQVRETKINIFVHQYELFMMQPDETIKEMFTRFTDITNNLKSLGKTYTNEEMVRKILRCLPKNKWGPKVTAIEEAQDLKTLALDDLLGKLLTHEIHLKEDDEEVQPKTGVAFKLQKKSFNLPKMNQPIVTKTPWQ